MRIWFCEYLYYWNLTYVTLVVVLAPGKDWHNYNESDPDEPSSRTTS